MQALLLLLGGLLIAPATCARPPERDAILLSDVHTLTLRADRMTSSRRALPVPQLSCDSSRKICDLYQPDVMRCRNSGYGYDLEDVQWTCQADLPPEFKLGATDVSCEGYRDRDDDWVLKGSCGVSYRLLLTELGEERYGHGHRGGPGGVMSGLATFQKICSWLGDLIFFGFLFTMAAMIFWPLLASCLWLRRKRRDTPHVRRRWGWGWGWGGPGHHPPPPPPYNPCHSCAYTTHEPAWTPGFWSGALSGMTAGYGLGKSANNGRRGTSGRSGGSGSSEGGSRSQQPGSTAPSTGFGTTTRR